MVELMIDPRTINRNIALSVYDHIKLLLLPEYTIRHSQDSFVTSYFLDDGELNCFIELNTHKKLTFLNKKIGKIIYNGEKIGVVTDDKNKVIDVAERLESIGYKVTIMIYERSKW